MGHLLLLFHIHSSLGAAGLSEQPPQPSPIPSARPTRAGGGDVETQAPQICDIAEVDSNAKSMNPRGGICASIRAIPGGKKGLFAKSRPKAPHRVRSPEEKDGAEIKSASLAPYGQSLTGGEGHLRLAGSLSRAL